MSAGIAYPGYFTEHDEEDPFDDEAEIILDDNLHSQAAESFQTRNFYRTANYTPDSYSGPARNADTFSFVFSQRNRVNQASGEWFRPNGHLTPATEAVYAYSAEEALEPLPQPGQFNLLLEQVRSLGTDLFHNRRMGLVVVLGVLVLLICGGLTFLTTLKSAESDIYRFSATVNPITTTTNPTQSKPQGNPPTATPGAHAVSGSPTITADKIAQVLKQYNSPAVGSSQAIYDLGVKYGIDPAYALAFFIHESSAGTQGIAVTTKSLGNIRQTTNSGFEGYQGFRKYPSWEAGAEDWYKLIRNLYIDGWNLPTVEKIIPKYAPSEDNNNPTSYINAVNSLVDTWRSGK